MLKRLLTLLATLILAAISLAQNTASLDIVINGLPPGANANVTLVGPGDTNLKLVQSSRVSRLRAGTYTLRAERVSFDGSIYMPNPSSQSLSLVGGRTYRSEIRYNIVSGDTPMGSILSLGQTWKQSGAELTLRKVIVQETRINIDFSITNKKNSTIVLRYNLSDVLSIQDNSGKLYTAVAFVAGTGQYVSCQEQRQVLEVNAKSWLSCDGFIPIVRIDFSDPMITEIIIVITSISTITEARWKVPVEK